MFRACSFSLVLVLLLSGFLGCGGERKPTFEGVEQAAAQKVKTPAERIDYAIGALSREDPKKAKAACNRLLSFGTDAARAIPDLEKCAAGYPDDEVKAAAEAAIAGIQAAESESGE